MSNNLTDNYVIKMKLKELEHYLRWHMNIDEAEMKMSKIRKIVYDE